MSFSREFLLQSASDDRVVAVWMCDDCHGLVVAAWSEAHAEVCPARPKPCTHEGSQALRFGEDEVIVFCHDCRRVRLNLGDWKETG